MKVKYWARQVNPEFQEDDLFYTYQTKQGRYEMGWNDEGYINDIIITGNRDYHHWHTKEYENLLQLGSVYYEYEPLTYKNTNHCYWDSVTQFINAYFPKSNGKYSTKEIHKWKELLEKYTNHYDIEDIVCEALELMTGKKWREIKLIGCCQSDWQYGYASEDVSEEYVRYVEMCYFNTGSEYIVFEDRNDFKHNENGCSMYVESWQSKTYMARILGCKESEISMYDWDGYSHTPKYKRV